MDGTEGIHTSRKLQRSALFRQATAPQVHFIICGRGASRLHTCIDLAQPTLVACSPLATNMCLLRLCTPERYCHPQFVTGDHRSLILIRTGAREEDMAFQHSIQLELQCQSTVVYEPAASSLKMFRRPVAYWFGPPFHPQSLCGNLPVMFPGIQHGQCTMQQANPTRLPCMSRLGFVNAFIEQVEEAWASTSAESGSNIVFQMWPLHQKRSMHHNQCGQL